MEGAKIIRNIALLGTFWTGVVLLVTEAKANVYESEGVKAVSVTSGMNPGTVPQAEVKVDAGTTVSEGGGNANSGGVQVQNVTVQAGSTAEADSQSENSNSNALDAINRVRSDAETSNNALLLQQIELNRLKAEQKRIKAINEFGDGLEKPEVAQPVAPVSPCGAGPCVPQTAAPVIENNNSNIIVNDSAIGDKPVVIDVDKSASVETSIEDTSSSSSFFGPNSNVGVSSILGLKFYDSNTDANITNNYMIGLGFDVDYTKYLSFEGSFIYGSDKLAGFSCTGGCGYWNETTRSTYQLGMGVKVGPRMNNIRPYVSAGLGWLNQQYGAIYGRDYSTNNFTASLGGGVDFKINKNFSLGARGNYETVIGGTGDSLVYVPGGSRTLDQLYGDQGDRYSIGATASYNF